MMKPEMGERVEQYGEDLPQRTISPRLVGIVSVVVVCLLGLIAARTGVGGGAPGTPPTVLRSSAAGLVIITPGERTRRIAISTPVAGVRNRVTSGQAGYRYPDDGSVVAINGITATAQLRPVRVGARSRVHIGSIRLLGERVVLRNVRFEATSAVTHARAGGAVTFDRSTELVVDGTPRALHPNMQIPVAGVGVVSVNEQAVVAQAPRGDRQSGPRHRIVGAVAHLRVMRPVAGLAAGTDIVIGRVEAGVRVGRVRPVPHATYRKPAAPTRRTPVRDTPNPLTLHAGTPKPGAHSLPRKATSVRAAAAAPSGSLQRYVFPVLGSTNFTDTWGAPRASTGIPHQGTDIFGAEGTPIVAVADGVLDRVGWNTIGGYRFWLFDSYGNSFYFAHLSAYSPLARDGAQVRAGDVIGFLGHTGDAQFTPPHLHFEVHPNNGDAVNPYRYLLAWQRGRLVAADGIGLGAAISTLAFESYSDISANSGLDGSVLDSVPNTSARPVADETRPKPTDASLADAINGPGIASGS